MALSENKVVEIKKPGEDNYKVVDGAIHIFQGALLSFEAANIGYVQLAADVITAEFAGIAMEELNVAAADNTSNGTFSVKCLTRGCGKWVKLNVRSTITINNIGDPVYVDGDDYVDIASGIVNSTTTGFVGIIRQFVDGNTAWVQLTQHPTL